MSIFGTGAPVIENVETGTILQLNYTSIKKYDFDDSETKTYKYLNGNREFFEKSNHFNITYTMFFNKFSDPIQAYLNLVAFNKQSVYLKLHNKKQGGLTNNVYLRADNGDYAVFYVKKIIPFYLDSAGNYDAANIELVSKTPMNIANIPLNLYNPSINTNIF